VLEVPDKLLGKPDKILLKAYFLLKWNSVTLRKKYVYEKKPNLFWKCYKQANEDLGYSKSRIAKCACADAEAHAELYLLSEIVQIN